LFAVTEESIQQAVDESKSCSLSLSPPRKSRAEDGGKRPALMPGVETLFLAN
jgi:hypothetical protein